MISRARARSLIFLGTCHLLAASGLFVATLLMCGLLTSSIHALGHAPHVLSSLGKALGDNSPVPFHFAVLVVCTALLLLVLERWVRCSSGVDAFLRAYPAASALSLTITLSVTALLWSADILHIPEVFLDLPNPYHFVTLMWVSAGTLGLYCSVAYLGSRRPFPLCALIGTPIFLALLTTYTIAAEVLNDRYGIVAPVAYPRATWVTGLAVAFVTVSAFLWWASDRVLKREHAGHVGLVVAGLWGWAFGLFVCLGFLGMFGHMCVTVHSDIHRIATAWVSALFAGLWIAILIGYWLAHARQRRPNRP